MRGRGTRHDHHRDEEEGESEGASSAVVVVGTREGGASSVAVVVGTRESETKEGRGARRGCVGLSSVSQGPRHRRGRHVCKGWNRTKEGERGHVVIVGWASEWRHHQRESKGEDSNESAGEGQDGEDEVVIDVASSDARG